jgi:hypothetical protein
MDLLVAAVLFGAAGYALYKWLQRRNEPKPFSPAPVIVTEAQFNQRVDELLRLGVDGMIGYWQQLIIAKGGNYVPPTLGEGMSDMEIATEVAALELGVRY